MKYTEEAKSYLTGLAENDKARLNPIIELFDSCVPTAGAGYYHPNILILNVNEQPAIAISPRKQYISIYVWSQQSFSIFKEAMPKLGKVNAGKGCLRFAKLQDLNMITLKDVFSRLAASKHDSAMGFT